MIKIISGGQTGPDRAALDFALSRGMAHGGWCPRGRFAEDGPIPERYRLEETPSADPAQRTEWNVRDSDGSVIFSTEPSLTGGSKRTREFAIQHQKPWLHLCATELDNEAAAIQLGDFIKRYQVGTLNVAGPRASEDSGAAAFVKRVLEAFQRQRVARR